MIGDMCRPITHRGTLVCTVGLSRSGKSTWAKGTGLPVISADAVRLALFDKRFDAHMEPLVWGHLLLALDAMFIAGNETIILDSTALTPEHRAKFEGRGYNIKYKIFDTPIEVCKERAMKTYRDPTFPGIIDQMAEKRDVSDIKPEELWNG